MPSRDPEVILSEDAVNPDDPRWVEVGARFDRADALRRLAQSRELRGPRFKLRRQHLREQAQACDFQAIRLREQITGEKET